MGLREVLINIIDNYLPVRSLNDEQKILLKDLVQVHLTNEVRQLLSSQKSLEVKGRTRQSKWADVPWVGIHDSRINSSAQSGIYVTILFKVDGSGFAFSIQHGTENYALSEIPTKAREVSEQLLVLPNSSFSSSPLVLRSNNDGLSNSSRPAKYELANIFGKMYWRDSLPYNLEDDLLLLVRIYEDWIKTLLSEDSEDEYQNVEEFFNNESIPLSPPQRNDKKRVRLGSLYPPRDKKEGVIALHKANYTCEANSSHQTFLREDGKPYMEKHHLIPMDKYFQFDLSVDHFSNIYSLCPTCHRKIHYGIKGEKKELIRQLYEKRAESYMSFYNITLEQLYSYY